MENWEGGSVIGVRVRATLGVRRRQSQSTARQGRAGQERGATPSRGGMFCSLTDLTGLAMVTSQGGGCVLLHLYYFVTTI